jgi:hypothetical protein
MLENGSLEETLKFQGCARSQVYKWRHQREELQQSDRENKRLKGGGRPIKNEKVDELALSYVLKVRAEGHAVSGRDIQSHVRESPISDEADHKGSNGWLEKFLGRNDLVSRSETTRTPQRTPSDKLLEMQMFKRFLRLEMRTQNISSEAWIFNVDQTSIHFDMPRRRTVERSGTKEVRITRFRKGGPNVTVFLCVAANGEKLPPFVVFKAGNKTNRAPRGVTCPDGVIAAGQESAWATIPIVVKWINEVFKPWLIERKIQSSVILMDELPSHTNHDVKFELMKHNAKSVIIPGGDTSILQPLDVSVNRSFKAKMRKSYAEWSKEQSPPKTVSGKSYQIDYNRLLEHVQTSWNSITADTIRNGWRQCGLTFERLPPPSEHLPQEFYQWLGRT